MTRNKSTDSGIYDFTLSPPPSPLILSKSSQNETKKMKKSLTENSLGRSKQTQKENMLIPFATKHLVIQEELGL